jgi:hypothetical protein
MNSLYVGTIFHKTLTKEIAIATFSFGMPYI